MRKLFTALTLLGLMAAASASAGSYTVGRNDTLAAIAGRVHRSVAWLVRANGLSHPDHLEVGEVLRVDDPPPATYTVRRGETLGGIAHRLHTTTRALVDANRLRRADHLRA